MTEYMPGGSAEIWYVPSVLEMAVFAVLSSSFVAVDHRACKRDLGLITDDARDGPRP